MAISVVCTQCNKVYRVKNELAGQLGKCPSGHVLVVPAKESEPRRGDVWQSGWLWGVVGSILIATVPAVILWSLNRPAEKKTDRASDVRKEDARSTEKETVQPTDMLKEGTKWEGAFRMVSPIEDTYEAVLWINERRGESFIGEFQWTTGKRCVVEGTVQGEKVYFRFTRLLAGKIPDGTLGKAEFAGTLKDKTVAGTYRVPETNREGRITVSLKR